MIEFDGYENEYFIGKGRWASVYKVGDKAYKLLNTPNNFSFEHIKQFLGKKRDIIVFPEDFIKDSRTDELIGYSMEYVKGVNVKEVIYNISIEDLNYLISKTEKKIKDISDEGILIQDLHAGNILWDTKNHKIRIVDIDDYEYKPGEILYKRNSIQFTKALIESMGSSVFEYTIKHKNLYKYLVNMEDIEDDKYLSFNDYLREIIKDLESQIGSKITDLRQIQNETDLIEKEENEEKNILEEYNKLLENPSSKLKRLKRIYNNSNFMKNVLIKTIVNKKIKKLDLPSLKYIDEKLYEEKKTKEYNSLVEKMCNDNLIYKNAIEENKQREKVKFKQRIENENNNLYEMDYIELLGRANNECKKLDNNQKGKER